MFRNKNKAIVITLLFIFTTFFACQKPADSKIDPPPVINNGDPALPSVPYDYKTVNLPSYISDFIKNDPSIDNTPLDNPITNEGATLGRVLFYDKHLSINDKIACASCHKQEMAFTDGNVFSTGFNGGLTTRNAMSVINLRYFKAKKMFLDLR